MLRCRILDSHHCDGMRSTPHQWPALLLARIDRTPRQWAIAHGIEEQVFYQTVLRRKYAPPAKFIIQIARALNVTVDDAIRIAFPDLATSLAPPRLDAIDRREPAPCE